MSGRYDKRPCEGPGVVEQHNKDNKDGSVMNQGLDQPSGRGARTKGKTGGAGRGSQQRRTSAGSGGH